MLIAGGQKIRSFNILELLKAVAEIRQVRTMILRVMVNIGIFFKDSVFSLTNVIHCSFVLNMMIFFIAQDGTGAVYLFGQQKSHQLMR
jgi:hypothetical protein